VKGKLQPVTIYELCGCRFDLQQAGILEDAESRIAKFEQARQLYRKRRWSAAQHLFQTILDRWPDDGPSVVYLKRGQDYLAEAPLPEWDGVFTMTHK
jgi:adenylate cyclase